MINYLTRSCQKSGRRHRWIQIHESDRESIEPTTTLARVRAWHPEVGSSPRSTMIWEMARWNHLWRIKWIYLPSHSIVNPCKIQRGWLHQMRVLTRVSRTLNLMKIWLLTKRWTHPGWQLNGKEVESRSRVSLSAARVIEVATTTRREKEVARGNPCTIKVRQRRLRSFHQPTWSTTSLKRTCSN